jgi:hypothetical protein
MGRFSARLWAGAAAVVLLAAPQPAIAQTDEIQVYDGGLARPGVFNLTLHANFTPSGLKIPAFAGAVVADKSLNGVPEWAYGVNSWFELGLYLPLLSRDKNTGWGIDGVKLRTLFAVPDADERAFFYGANLEFSRNAKRWDSTRFTSEVRLIVGWHLKRVDIIVNPIFDTAYDGIGNLDFAPSARVAYKVTPALAVAVEEYADFGPLRRLHAGREQSHALYGVVDYDGKLLDVEAGIGVGLTPATDKLTFKVILSRDLNSRK